MKKIAEDKERKDVRRAVSQIRDTLRTMELNSQNLEIQALARINRAVVKLLGTVYDSNWESHVRIDELESQLNKLRDK